MSHLLYHSNMLKIAKVKIWPLRTLGVKQPHYVSILYEF
jgi:hypothetical protein